MNFCTLFDSNYLSRGLAMYYSLEKTRCNFHLYIITFDDKCLSVLQQLKLSNATVVSLKEFEDEDLLKVKPSRTRAEYCWTASSSSILYCINTFKLSNCTYIDADMYFYNDPQVLLDEMKENSVMITAHRYTPKYDKSKLSGKYCVQFVTFKNDEYGMKVLNWWRNACIDWCYNRHEDGKFGDQKYLDDWPTRFEKVHELEHLGGGMALWNIQQYRVFMVNGKLQCRETATGKEFEPIFYHFHYLKYFTDGSVELGRRTLPDDAKELLYKPYVKELEIAKRIIEKIDHSFNSHGASAPPAGLKNLLVKIWRKLNNVYHIYNLKELLN